MSSPSSSLTRERDLEPQLLGCLLGTAVGDAVGLPAEGLSRARTARRYPARWSHRFVFGRGMLSDDTEHTVFVAEALLRSRGDRTLFQRSLARSLRWWLAALPAGTGLATARSILRLWLGWSPEKSGVWSAGNGPAMRSGLIGVVARDDEDERRRLVEASTQLTHRDPKALYGALAIAEAAAWGARGETERGPLLARLRSLGDHEWNTCMRALEEHLERGADVDQFVAHLGLEKEVGGYTYHSVPVALYAALHHAEDPAVALESVWRCGGDTDTTGAMCGAIVGARQGAAALPPDWVEGIVDWPRSTGTLRALARALAAPREEWSVVRYPAWGTVLRNPVFLLIVLAHGLRRLLPG